MSIGFFVEENAAVVWRGPMLHKAIQQFLEDVAWGELEYLLLDLPPGTGDVSMTLAQLLPQAKFVIVTTPQPAAQSVARRARRDGGQIRPRAARRDREHVRLHHSRRRALHDLRRGRRPAPRRRARRAAAGQGAALRAAARARRRRHAAGHRGARLTRLPGDPPGRPRHQSPQPRRSCRCFRRFPARRRPSRWAAPRCRSSSRNGALCRQAIRPTSEAQDKGESIVDASKLIGVEATGGASESLRVYNGGLLDQDTGLPAIHGDDRSERCRSGAGRRRRDKCRAQRHELVGLDDDRIAGPALLPTARVPRGRQPKDLTANHVSRAIRARARPSPREWPASRSDPPHQQLAARPPR